jgi:histidine ammonia-lyase
VVSMGTHAARWTRRVLPLVWKLSAIQAMALCQAADLREDTDRVLGADFRTLYDAVRAVSPVVAEDRPLFEDIDRVVGVLRGTALQARLLPPRWRG